MTKPTALLYTSNTGFTARYAQLLARSSGVPAYDSAQGRELPAHGSGVLYLGWLRAGRVMGLKSARTRYDVRAVCAVGMAPGEENYVRKLQSENGAEGLPFFYLRGGYAPEKLGGIYRLVMKPMGKLIAKAPPEEGGSTDMQEAFLHGASWVTEEALAPVLDWLKGQ